MKGNRIASVLGGGGALRAFRGGQLASPRLRRTKEAARPTAYIRRLIAGKNQFLAPGFIDGELRRK